MHVKFGLATTMAWLLSLMLMGFTVMQIKHISRMEFRVASGDES